MKTLSVALILFAAAASGMTPQRPVPAVSLEGRLNYPFLSERGGTVFLQVTVTTADILVPSERSPLNLAIVIDRSGSMGDERKFEYVRTAVRSLTDLLRSGDILSVVVYDDVVDVLRPSRTVGTDRASLRGILDGIAPRGSTNLGGGLKEGLRQVQRSARRDHVNRVVLLSDGLANVGVTDPAALDRIVRDHRRHGITVTTMGVGLDYNEDLMMGLAESGAGNYYFIERPTDMAAIVGKEFHRLSTVLAQSASLRLTAANGANVTDVVGYEFSRERGAVIVPLGDLLSGERRELTVALSVPPGTGTRTLVNGELRYETGTISREYPTFAASVRYTRDIADVERNRDLTVQASADIAVSTKKVEQAVQALDEGRTEEAHRILGEAKEAMIASPAATAAGAAGDAVRSQLGKMDTFQRSAREDDARRAKKSIQYENYRTQKQK